MATTVQSAPSSRPAGQSALKSPTHANDDPSKLEDQVSLHSQKLGIAFTNMSQAAQSALYRQPEQSPERGSNYPLDADHKLSSAGAAASLKYASPASLPSYPVAGLSNSSSSAGAAASLANANKKPFEHWKPEPSSSANTAALLATDIKPAPLWQPTLSAAGSKAAILAHKDGANVEIWTPAKSSYGNSAAGQAMRNKGLSPQLDYGYTTEGSRRALLAATGAMSGSRRRAGSTPVPHASYPDSANSASNALSAATFAHRPSSRSSKGSTAGQPPSTVDAGRIHNIAKSNISREMYSSNPPVNAEVEERARQDGLRAAALSMAKQMYNVEGDQSANKAHGRSSSTSTAGSPTSPVMQYLNLHEAAQKLAAERLAKIEQKDDAYLTYYGMNQPPPQARKSKKGSFTGRGRRRAASDSGSSMQDAERSRRIRSEMAQFSDKLADVDAQKRQKDRDALMAAAQRNVQASMHGMDEKVFLETGKVSPAMWEEWEAAAKARAQSDSEARLATHGKVNIGGGKFLDQSDVDAIALANVQPTLDEITDEAERHRAKDLETKLDAEESKRFAVEEKKRDAEVKAEQKRSKDEEKQAEKSRKAQEKATKAEEKRLAKEEKRRSRDKKARPVSEAAEEPAIEPETEAAISPGAATVTEATSEAAAPLAHATDNSAVTDDIPAVEADPEHPLTDDAKAVAERVVKEPVLKEPVASPNENSAAAEPPAAENSTEPTADVTAAEPVIASSTLEPPPALTSKFSEPSSDEARATATTARESSPPQRSPTSPKPDGRVKNWLRGKFSLRSKSKPKTPDATDNRGSFVGGATLTGAGARGANASSTSLDHNSDSVRDVAMVGRPESQPTAPAVTTKTSDVLPSVATNDEGVHQHNALSSPSISSLSSTEHDHHEPRGRLSRRHEVNGVGSGAHDDDGADDEFEEARDTFDDGEHHKLAPPQPPPTGIFGSTAARGQGESPVRDSKFQEVL
ncbi:MAG: hypothetical protein M1819_002273 [Sarea resinae]|nr:MAG: hypothetical protein M1819_002273 [Sarea resinae]